jgi:hypothetical protein
METLSFEAEPFREHGCGCDACREVGRDDELGLGTEIVDYVMNRKSGTRSYGKRSPRIGETTEERCLDGKARKCPDIPDLESVTKIDGTGFEYIAGVKNKPGVIYDKATSRYVVGYRIRERVQKLRPAVGDALSAFLSNMKTAGLPVEMILTMGSTNCRCVSNSNALSFHSYGEAIDIGGVRLAGGREVLVANSECVPEDRRTLHRINACLRLSFASVYDYHDRMPLPTHWNHFHCDIDKGGPRPLFAKAVSGNFHRWGFIRESLGLPWKGGFDKACSAALRAFAGEAADDNAPALRRTLGQLFIREALAEPPDRAPRYSCRYPRDNKAKPG